MTQMDEAKRGRTRSPLAPHRPQRNAPSWLAGTFENPPQARQSTSIAPPPSGLVVRDSSMLRT